MSADANTGYWLDSPSTEHRDDLPWTCSCGDGSATLLEQFVCDVPQPSSRLYCRNVGRLVQCDVEHAIKLNDEMAVLSAQTGTGVGVSTTLCGDFEASRTTTVDSGLDLWNGDRNSHRCRCVLKARVERFDVCCPVGAASFVDRNGRFGQAVVYSSSATQRKRIAQGKEAQESENEDFCSHDLEKRQTRQTSCCLRRMK